MVIDDHAPGLLRDRTTKRPLLYHASIKPCRELIPEMFGQYGEKYALPSVSMTVVHNGEDRFNWLYWGATQDG